MFSLKCRVHLKDTDMTGVIFFSHLFTFAGETLETWLFEKNIYIEKEPFFIPVVHAEGDYIAPIKMGDVLDISLYLEKMGKSSFTLGTKMKNQEGTLVATTKVVYVSIERESWTSTPIPEKLKQHLSSLES